MAFKLNYKEDGQAYSGTELLENLGFSLAMQIDLALNQMLNNYDTIALDAEYFIFDTLNDETKVNTSSSTCLYGMTSTKGLIAFCSVLDLFDDSSIDSNIWTTSVSGGSVSENTARLNLNCKGPFDTVSVISDGASGLDLKSFSGNSEVIMLGYSDVTNKTSGVAERRVQISNGSTHVNIEGFASTDSTLRIVVNKSAETVDVYRDDTLVDNDVDISSVTTNWYLRFYIDHNGSVNSDAESNINIYCVGYLDGNAGSSIFQSTARTHSSSKNLINLRTRYAVEPSTKTLSGSLDNASNFTTLTESEITSVSNSGTQSVVKYNVTHPTSISASSKNIPSILGYGYIVS